MNVLLHEDVKQDLSLGFDFYEGQEKGLGNYFLDSLWADLESLRIYAGIHVEQFGFQRMLARTFPFAIYYRVEENAVRVYAVLDCRRNPDDLRRRLTTLH